MIKHTEIQKHTLICLIIFVFLVSPTAGQTKKVLFIGNSYTYVNNLPQLTANVAASAGDTLIFDSSTMGSGYLGQHLTNNVSITKIKTGNWDHVILQDQSLALAYPPPYFYHQYSGVYKLDSIIKDANHCEQTLFFATWGRKNGDSYFCGACPTPTTIVRTYFEMDSTIQVNYKFYADSLKALVSPVGAVWRYIRRNYPNIELHQADESHPELAGSYAAACCFYAAIFRKNPAAISFNAGLNAADAANIRHAAKVTVYDQLLNWNIGKYDSITNVNCSVTGIKEVKQNAFWQLYPNPAAETLTIKINDFEPDLHIEILNANGTLVKRHKQAAASAIDISDLPKGLYIIRLYNTPYPPLKFIKQ